MDLLAGMVSQQTEGRSARRIPQSHYGIGVGIASFERLDGQSGHRSRTHSGNPVAVEDGQEVSVVAVVKQDIALQGGNVAVNAADDLDAEAPEAFG